MVTRNLSTPAALAVGLSVGLLAQYAAATEAHPTFKSPVVVDVSIDEQPFRREVEAYLRTLSKEISSTLDQELRRSLAPKIELATNELRARG
jgi:hypothetical protein